MPHELHNRNRCVLPMSAIMLMFAVSANSADAEKKQLSYKGEQAIAVSTELLVQGRYKDALASAEDAIRADPKSGIPQAHKAFVLEKMKQTKKSEQAYDKALKLSPDDGYVLNAVAINVCARGKAAESDALFVRAVKDLSYPVPQQALQNAGSCALKAGNINLAEQRLRSALSVDPDARISLELLSDIKFRQYNFFEARAFMQRREALGPLNVPLLKLAQQIEKSAGDDRAAAQYQKQLDILQAQIQPPTGEGQKQP